MLRRLAIRPKLFFVVAAPIAFLLFAMAVSLGTLNRVKITGPEYQKINELDQLRMDVSPPTQYLGRSYGEVQSLLNEVDPDEQIRIIEDLGVLERAYMDRHAYWEKTLPPGDFRTLLLETSYAPAAKFWQHTGQIAASIKAGDRPGAIAIAQGPLRDAFIEHEAAIIRLADLAEQQRSSVEVNASNMVKSQSLFMLAMFLAVITATAALGSMVARAIQRPISQLQLAASEAVEALSSTDVDAGHIPDIAPVVVDSEDEAAAAATSFNSLLATTMELLRKQARMRRNNTEMFINLGRRNQNLVSRQLKFIDSLERSETDPELLASLFRLDHLATRMRRNAESLLVLAGLESPRKWRNPVPALEVARSAASEAEQFERIEFGSFDELMIAGTAVANVVHLLAELLDNAVRYSPPDTVVTVSGVTVGDSLVITIADLGMGMSDQDLAAANARLASMQDLDEVPTAHLGLFVVARLAARHGIAVRLDSRGGEGLTALVALPPTILADITGKPRTKGASPEGGGMTPAAIGSGPYVADGPVASKGGKVMARPTADDDGRPIKPRRKKGEPEPTPEPAYANGSPQTAPADAAYGQYNQHGQVAGGAGLPASGPAAMAATLLPEAPPLPTPAAAPAKSGGALGRFQPRRRKGGDSDDAPVPPSDAPPSDAAPSDAAPVSEPIPATGFDAPQAVGGPGIGFEPLPTRKVESAPQPEAPTSASLSGPPILSGPQAVPVFGQLADERPQFDQFAPVADGPAFGPAAPAFGAGGVFGTPEPTVAVPASSDSWRTVELPADVASPLVDPAVGNPGPALTELRAPQAPTGLPASQAPTELPTRPVREAVQPVEGGDTPFALPATPTPADLATAQPTTDSGAVMPAPPLDALGAVESVQLEPGAPISIPASDIVDASRYAALPRATKTGASAIEPNLPAPSAVDADAGPAEVVLPGRPRTPLPPTRMPSVGLAGAADESPFSSDSTPALPARPAAPDTAAPAPAVPAPRTTAKPPVVPPPPAVAKTVVPPPAVPARSAQVTAPAAPAKVPAPPAVPPVPAQAAVPGPPAVPTAPPAVPTAPSVSPARPPAERAEASLPSPAPRLPSMAPAAASATEASADGEDPTTPSGLRKRVRQEPAVPFNRFAQQDDVNVRKSRSPEAMKDRLMSFTAGKSAAKTTDADEVVSDETEPQFVSRTDQVQDSPSTNPPPKS